MNIEHNHLKRSFKALDKDMTVIQFEANSTALEDIQRLNLESLVNHVRRDEKILSVIVSGWADLDYPTAKGQTLGLDQRALARERIDKIFSELRKIGIDTVELHSMAERPRWIDRMFNTRDAIMKGEGYINSANDKLIVDIGKILNANGGPGKVVIIVRRSGDFVA